jgi:precorrin-3B synthase
VKRGWCPGVHEPMASGDGLLIRVKPFGGKLTADALRTLAVVAAGCGNGAVELTGRGNIQLRGLTEATAPLAAQALVEAGLADADPVREARRNVIAVPPCDDALVAAIEAALVEVVGLAPKFCVAVGAARADIQVLGDRVVAGGKTIRTGEDAAEAVRHLAESADGRRLGIQNPPDAPLPAGLLLGLPFGQTDAAALMVLADLVANSSPWSAQADHPRLACRRGEERRGSSAFAEDGGGEMVVRTTPWRAFFLAGAHDPAPFATAGFITDADDPRRSIAACAGAPACASASVPARVDAAFLAARGVRGVHVSGCAKGCAHPGDAVTLVGLAGSYGFVRSGRAGDRPTVTGLTIAQAAEMLA